MEGNLAHTRRFLSDHPDPHAGMLLSLPADGAAGGSGRHQRGRFCHHDALLHGCQHYQHRFGHLYRGPFLPEPVYGRGLSDAYPAGHARTAPAFQAAGRRPLDVCHVPAGVLGHLLHPFIRPARHGERGYDASRARGDGTVPDALRHEAHTVPAFLRAAFPDFLLQQRTDRLRGDLSGTAFCEA